MESIAEQNLVFNHNYAYCRDGESYRIKSCMFDSPLPLDKAIEEIRADKKVSDTLAIYKYFLQKILNQVQTDIALNKNLRDIKVNGMINYGQTAFVFETEDGDILKITSRDHFLGRKSVGFDIPIKEQFKILSKTFCRYYLEEKTHDDFSGEELSVCLDKIRKAGYKIVDYRPDQFGKTKDGQIVLIDPECARKRGVFGLLKHKFVKLKSYAKIIAK